jgi:hypothetical protein
MYWILGWAVVSSFLVLVVLALVAVVETMIRVGRTRLAGWSVPQKEDGAVE